MDNLQDIISTYGYAAIIVLTFLEGETVVILAGIAAYQGYLDINLVLLSALTGSFAGDQFYFAIGRKYGTPLLEKWPHFTKKIDWAFKMLRKWETPFILSFRFIYGIRNVSPFVIGMSGISPVKYFILNLIAAVIWASSFAYGGYYFGTALEKILGEHQTDALLIIAGLMSAVGIYAYMRKNLKVRQARAEKDTAPPKTEDVSTKQPEPDASLTDDEDKTS